VPEAIYAVNPRPYLKSVEFKCQEDADWSSYPFSIPAVNDLEKIEFHPTEHYQITKDFLNSYQRRVHQIIVD